MNTSTVSNNKLGKRLVLEWTAGNEYQMFWFLWDICENEIKKAVNSVPNHKDDKGWVLISKDYKIMARTRYQIVARIISGMWIIFWFEVQPYFTIKGLLVIVFTHTHTHTPTPPPHPQMFPAMFMNRNMWHDQGNESDVGNTDFELQAKRGDNSCFTLFLNFTQNCSHLYNQMSNWVGVWIKM